VRYPAFFHARTVIVQGTVRIVEGTAWLEASADVRIHMLRVDINNDGKRIQVKGTFLDVGRLTANDPRVAKLGVDSLVSSGGRRDWPRQGEMLVLSAERDASYSPASAPASFLAVVLDPERFLNKSVVLVGQFRGRNLVGDQPAAPGLYKAEFVLRNGTSSIWVVGREPQGSDFKLDPAAPKDVGRWLRASGVVRRQNDLVYVEATSIERGESVPEAGTIGPEGVVSSMPGPNITFSSPIQNGGDISRKVVVRVQFSRVMNGDSFVGRVRASYADSGPPGSSPVRDPEFMAFYVLKDQVIEIRFAAPLEPNRRVKIELLDGIATPDGSALKPWSLTFTTGER